MANTNLFQGQRGRPIVAAFAAGQLHAGHWVGEISALNL